MGKLSAFFVHTWIGRRPQRAVRGGYVFQVGNFSAGFVPSWMRWVPQRVVRGGCAFQVGNFSGGLVPIWMRWVPQRVVRGGCAFQVGNFSSGFVPSWRGARKMGRDTRYLALYKLCIFMQLYVNLLGFIANIRIFMHIFAGRNNEAGI